MPSIASSSLKVPHTMRCVEKNGSSHAIAFAQMRRTVCQRQLSVLYIISVLVLTSKVTL